MSKEKARGKRKRLATIVQLETKTVPDIDGTN